MTFDLNNFEDVEKVHGGRREEALSINKAGYFRMNRQFVENNELKNVKFANIKTLKDNDKLIIAINFSEDKRDNSYSASYFEKNKSYSFSGRSIFSKYGFNYEKVLAGENRKLDYKVQEHEGEKYFIVEIRLK